MSYILSFIVAFGVTFIAGQILVPLLRKWKAGQSIREDGPTWHMSKQGTPTMGGLMFILGIGVAIVTAGWEEIQRGNFIYLFVYLFALVFGAIGFVDDFQKLRHHANEGLTALQKFLLQLAAAVAFTVLLRNYGYLTPSLYIPFFNVELAMPWVVYMIFAAFVMVATVNAVNLTDGIDGLASSVTFVVMMGFMFIASLLGNTTMALFAAAVAGGCAGFLAWNFYPAKTFMGDTGSMFLGGAVVAVAYGIGRPELLLFMGVIYLIEAFSVMLQVTYFKLTHGKRIFKMSPIHHHFEMCGWSEVKIVSVFSFITLVGVVLGGIFVYVS